MESINVQYAPKKYDFVASTARDGVRDQSQEFGELATLRMIERGKSAILVSYGLLLNHDVGF